MAEEADNIMAGLTGDDTATVEAADVDTTVETSEETETAVEESQASDEQATDSEAEVTEESEESETTESDETEETEATEELDQKELARQAYQRRQQERAEREAKVAEAQREHLEQAQDDQDLALRQLQIDAYNNKVTINSDKLVNQYNKALVELEVFRDPSPEIAEALADAVDEFEARYVTFDTLGNPIDVKGDLYQHLSIKADRIQKLAQIGARKEKAGVAKSRAAVTPAPSTSPKESKKDPIMEGLLSND